MASSSNYLKIFGLFFLFSGVYYAAAYIAGYLNNGVFYLIVLFILFSSITLMRSFGPEVVLCFFVVVLVTQPFFTSLISGSLDGQNVKLLVAGKEIILLMILFSLYKPLRGDFLSEMVFLDYCSLFLILAFCFSALYGGASLFAKVLSLREGVFIGICYFIGRFSFSSPDRVFFFCKFVSIVAVLVSLFGVFEYSFFTLKFWGDLGALDYAVLKRGDSVSFTLSSYVPNQWFSFYFGEYFRRMVSVIMDPTSLSRFLAFPLLYLSYAGLSNSSTRLNVNLLFSLLIFSAIALSFGKGGMMIVLCGYSVMAWSVSKVFSITFMILMLAMVIVSGFLEGNYGNLIRHTSHYSSVFGELLNQPLGSGLGASGQQAANHGLLDGTEGEESFFVSFIRQCGVLGLISFFLFFFGGPSSTTY
jgi:hypothetical protein